MACTPQELSDSSKEFVGLNFKLLMAMTAASLSNGATPQEMAAASKCFTCLSKKQLLAIWAYSLCVE